MEYLDNNGHKGKYGHVLNDKRKRLVKKRDKYQESVKNKTLEEPHKNEKVS